MSLTTMVVSRCRYPNNRRDTGQRLKGSDWRPNGRAGLVRMTGATPNLGICDRRRASLDLGRICLPGCFLAMRNAILTYIKPLGIVGLLYLFLVSIGLMAKSFVLFGGDFAEGLITTTDNPLVGLCIGVLVTSLVQSSSLTTSLVVGMVAGGAMSVTNAVPLIMGANIGTSVTNILVSLGHITRKQEFRRAFAASTVHDFFNVIAVAVLFPLQLATGFLGKAATSLADVFQNSGGLTFTSPVKAVVKPTVAAIAHEVGPHPVLMLVLAAICLFVALRYLTTLLRSLVISRLEAFFDTHIFKTVVRAFLFGLMLTVLVQSSSITTSLVVPLAGAGILTVMQIYPYTLGANIGTTVTALMASMVSVEAAPVAVAFSHLLFNICGIAIVWPMRVIRNIPVRLANRLADSVGSNRAVPFVFVIVTFFLVPLLIVFFL